MKSTIVVVSGVLTAVMFWTQSCWKGFLSSAFAPSAVTRNTDDLFCVLW